MIHLIEYKSYDPPDEEILKQYYDEGFQAALNGKELDDNPYHESGHERDTTFEDEKHYQWYSGFIANPSL